MDGVIIRINLQWIRQETAMSEKRQLTDIISLTDVQDSMFLKGLLVGLELGKWERRNKEFWKKKKNGNRKTA